MVNSIIWAIVFGVFAAGDLLALMDLVIGWCATKKMEDWYTFIIALVASVLCTLACISYAKDIRDYIKEPVIVTTVPPEITVSDKDSLTVTYQFHENLYK